MEVLDGGIQIIDIEGNVMPSHVAVARLVEILMGGLKLEYLEIWTKGAPIEAKFLECAPRVDVQVFCEPVIVPNPRSERVNEFATDDIDKEGVSLRNGGDGESDVFRTAEPRNS